MNHIPPAIQSDNWLDYAASFPIAFAQVREDALTDQWIANRLPAAAQGIMIASGGCTAAALAASGRFERLMLVDMNPAQLAVAKLKVAFVSDYSTEERLDLLGHGLGQHTSMQSEELKSHQIPADIFGDFETVSAIGLDYTGRYELLFARLQHVIADTATTAALLKLDSPTKQADFLKEHPAYVEQLKQAFAEVMALPNLVRLFGEEATQNSVMLFSEHFYQRTIHAIETLPAASNPYLAQLLLGQFTATAMYPWLELPKQPIHTRIEYKQSAMAQALGESSESFDFIHLSNILDWLSMQQAKALLEAAAAKLKKGGWLIIRQLNSNLSIAELCNSLTWQADIAARLHQEDRSFFYQKLHIARKE
jgi:S-adenosylmethionine-diacylglycerol 3-amino-3-carboxypropyl transferase